MLKLCGCVCILAASSGMAYTCILGLYHRLRQTELLADLFTAMEGELTYSRCPLPELLSRLSRHSRQPYAELLMQAARRMEENKEADIPLLWEDVCTQYRRQMSLPSEAYEALLKVGEAFSFSSFSSLDASLRLLQPARRKLDVLIRDQYAQLSGKRKLYCCLCYTAGLFFIIILL